MNKIINTIKMIIKTIFNIVNIKNKSTNATAIPANINNTITISIIFFIAYISP